MKISFILSVTFLVAIQACLSRYQRLPNIIFSYDILSYDSLKYELITQDKFLLQFKNEIKGKNRLYDYEEHIYLIDSILNIRYFRYIQPRFYVDSDLSFQRDKLEFFGLSINLDSLFYEEEYTKTIEPRVSTINSLYKFSFANRKYLCFYIQDITNPAAMLNTYILLFDITNLNYIKLVLHDFQASEDLKCFGDFNKNNKLDFVSWTFGNIYTDTLFFYELDSTGKQFVIDNNHFILIKDSLNKYFIDLKESKWFHNSAFSNKRFN